MVTLSWKQFENHCALHGLPLQVMSRSEWEAINAPKESKVHEPPPTTLIERANKLQFDAMWRAEGVDPGTRVASPVLHKLLLRQKAERDQIDPPSYT